MSVSAVPKTSNSLLVAAKDATGQPLASASAQLNNDLPSFIATQSTGLADMADFGQAYFGGLYAGNYQLKINLDGYQEATAAITIAGNKQESVTLNQLQ